MLDARQKAAYKANETEIMSLIGKVRTRIKRLVSDRTGSEAWEVAMIDEILDREHARLAGFEHALAGLQLAFLS